MTFSLDIITDLCIQYKYNITLVMQRRPDLGWKRQPQNPQGVLTTLARNQCTKCHKVVRELRSAKLAYFRKLNPSNTKQFWKAVKYLNKGSSSVPVLTHNNVTHDSDEATANVLNSFFFLNLFQ